MSTMVMLTGADFALQRRLEVAFKACLRYIHMKRQPDHVSHLESTVTGTLLVDNARVQLLSFSYKILYVRHPSYLFSMFHFASSARTGNLTWNPPHIVRLLWVSHLWYWVAKGFLRIFGVFDTPYILIPNWKKVYLRIHDIFHDFGIP
jgi:hypothetical protein